MIDRNEVADVKQQLDRILRSVLFTRHPPSADLLRFLGTRPSIDAVPTEREIGIAVFRRDKNWEPKNTGDTIVRTNITRLKDRLAEYYADEGCGDPVIIDVTNHKIISRPNAEVLLTPRHIPIVGGNFVAARDRYFTEPNEPGPRCVVTADNGPVVWYHLDGDPYNPALGNTVPLCGRLNAHLKGLRQPGARTNLSVFDPQRLERLAMQYYRDWKFARAYGCAVLAFYMGVPPYGEESEDVRLLRLCAVVYYARHHFFEPVIHYVLQQMLQPLLFRMDSINPIAAARLAVQLTALLEEACYFDDAEMALSLANRFSHHAVEGADTTASLDAFRLARRRAQLLGERAPEDARFDDVLRRAEDLAGNAKERALTLQGIRVSRWLRQGSYRASQRAYETLVPLIAPYRHSLFRHDQLIKPKGLGVAELADLSIKLAIAACRVQPGAWEDDAEQMVAQGKALLLNGGHVLASEFSSFLSREPYKNKAKAHRLLQLAPSLVGPPLRLDARTNIAVILKCLAKMRLLEKRAAPRR